MARPTPTRKQSVDLASTEARISRIRREPPAAAKEKKKLSLAPDERERWAVAVGIGAFALALFIIILAFGGYSGWSPRQYTVELRAAE